jgi:hypothetical protein
MARTPAVVILAVCLVAARLGAQESNAAPYPGNDRGGPATPWSPAASTLAGGARWVYRISAPVDPTQPPDLSRFFRRDSASQGRWPRRTHVAIGAIGGFLLGALAGAVHATNVDDKCRGQSCEAGPNFDGPIFAILYGTGGALLGGAVAWFWPTDRS